MFFSPRATMDTLMIDFEDDLSTDGEENAHDSSDSELDDKCLEPDDIAEFPLTKDESVGATLFTATERADALLLSDDGTDDDDDNITVSIDPVAYKKQIESNRLNRVLEHKYYPTSFPQRGDFDGNRGAHASAVYQLRPDDIELNNEIDRLIAVSVRLRTDNVITVFVRNTLILVPTHVPISSRLADCIWPTEKVHTIYRFNNQDLFNSTVPETRRLETMAFFAARYTKVQVVPKQKYRPPQPAGNRQMTSPAVHDASTGQFLYDDFTLMIVAGGKVIDSAIHGVRGNINDLVSQYKPRRIYCNMMPGDALHVFLNYPHQPFFRTFQNLMAPVYVDTAKVPMNTLPFCSRHDPYCSFCKTLLTVRGFFQCTPNTPRAKQLIVPAYRKNETAVDRRTGPVFTHRCRRRARRLQRAAETAAAGHGIYTLMHSVHRQTRPRRRPTYSPTANLEYERKLANTLSPRYETAPRRTMEARRVYLL